MTSSLARAANKASLPVPGGLTAKIPLPYAATMSTASSGALLTGMGPVSFSVISRQILPRGLRSKVLPWNSKSNLRHNRQGHPGAEKYQDSPTPRLERHDSRTLSYHLVIVHAHEKNRPTERIESVYHTEAHVGYTNRLHSQRVYTFSQR